MIPIHASCLPSCASAASTESEEEIVLKNALAQLSEGKMLPNLRSWGAALKKIQRKEQEMVAACKERVAKPDDQEVQEHVREKHSEYCHLLGELEVMPQLRVYYLLLENALLAHQIRRLQPNAK